VKIRAQFVKSGDDSMENSSLASDSISIETASGARVRQTRLKSNPVVTQEDLAGRLAGQGILLDRTAVSRIESRDRYVMDYEALAIARALRVTVSWLFGQER
jgi:HTH-type transcriptional regulator, cell division transcriptional repressor